MEKDLFGRTKDLPIEIQDILFKYALLDQTYENCERLLKELEPLGYSFEYGLDAIPYELHKIN